MQSTSSTKPALLAKNQSIRLICLPDVIAKTSLSKTSVYTLPSFPKPVKIKAGAGKQGGARWIEAEVDAWMLSLIQIRDSKGGAK